MFLTFFLKQNLKKGCQGTIIYISEHQKYFSQNCLSEKKKRGDLTLHKNSYSSLKECAFHHFDQQRTIWGILAWKGPNPTYFQMLQITKNSGLQKQEEAKRFKRCSYSGENLKLQVFGAFVKITLKETRWVTESWKYICIIKSVKETVQMCCKWVPVA